MCERPEGQCKTKGWKERETEPGAGKEEECREAAAFHTRNGLGHTGTHSLSEHMIQGSERQQVRSERWRRKGSGGPWAQCSEV